MNEAKTNKIFDLKKVLRLISKKEKHSSRKTGKEHKPAIHKRNTIVEDVTLKMNQPYFKSEQCKN